MWLYTKLGFYSIVKAKDDRTRFLIRGRVRADMEALLSAVGIPNDRIVETMHTDYRYRLVVSPEEMRKAFAVLLASLDYGNFKSMVADSEGYERAGLYGQVWEITRTLQVDPFVSRR